jgi:glycosyltransferase involved in cell wall biosynthesis
MFPYNERKSGISGEGYVSEGTFSIRPNVKSREYIVITSVKNEEENLPDLVKSVVEQTIKPVLWVIVDDNSTDNSYQMLKGYQKKHGWIDCIKYATSPEEHEAKKKMGNIDLRLFTYFHVSFVKKYGIDYAIRYIKEHNMQYDYLSIIDGDMTLDINYFEGVIGEMKKDKNLGIASGATYSRVGKNLILEIKRSDQPEGQSMVFSKECYIDIGGITPSLSYDGVCIVKAKNKGWKTLLFRKYHAYQCRRTGGRGVIEKGNLYHGFSDYYLNLNPLVVFLKFLKFVVKQNSVAGKIYIHGYLYGWRKHIPKSELDDLRRYYMWRRPVEIFKDLLGDDYDK